MVTLRFTGSRVRIPPQEESLALRSTWGANESRREQRRDSQELNGNRKMKTTAQTSMMHVDLYRVGGSQYMFPMLFTSTNVLRETSKEPSLLKSHINGGVSALSRAFAASYVATWPPYISLPVFYRLLIHTQSQLSLIGSRSLTTAAVAAEKWFHLMRICD